MDKFIRLLVLLLPISVFAAEPEKAEQPKCHPTIIKAKIKGMEQLMSGDRALTLNDFKIEAMKDGGCNLVAYNEFVKRKKLEDDDSLSVNQ